MRSIFIALLALSQACQVVQASEISSSATNVRIQQFDFPSRPKTRNLPFVSHTGSGPFDNALALNVEYAPFDILRKQIELALKRKLSFFRGWNVEGEAHVTVVTPPEFANVLSKVLTMKDIELIAQSNKIQSADLTVYGLGSGKKNISDMDEETFFVIVESNTLRSIRMQIWQAYTEKGGHPKDWDPSWFFPHITVGFTKQDLHEPDVLKNIKHSFDSRFRLRLLD